IDRNEPAAGKHEAQPLLADRRQHGTGVASQLAGDAPLFLAGALVEGDDAGAVALDPGEVDLVAAGRAAADLHDQQIALDDGRAADAEEILHDAVILLRVHLPERLAIGSAQAVQHTFRAMKVDAVAVDDGAAAWAVAVTVAILIVGLVLEFPMKLAARAVKAAEAGLVFDAVEQIELGVLDRRGAVALAGARVPADAKA